MSENANKFSGLVPEKIEDPYKDRLLRNAFPVKPTGPGKPGDPPRYFVFPTTPDMDSIYDIFRVWLNVAQKDTGEFIAAPFISPIRIRNRMKPTRRGSFVDYSPEGCPLSPLLKNNHAVVAINSFGKPKDGEEPKKNIDKLYCIKMLELEAEIAVDPTGKRSVNKGSDGNPIFKTNGIEVVVELRESWFKQMYSKILNPSDSVVDDEISSTTSKKLPTSDLTKLIIAFKKLERVEKKTGNEKMDIDYVIDFSDKFLWTGSSNIAPENKLPEFSELYPATTQSEVDDIVAKFQDMVGGEKATTENAPAEDSASSYTAPSSIQDDIPF
jgi:hypothetical protein